MIKKLRDWLPGEVLKDIFVTGSHLAHLERQLIELVDGTEPDGTVTISVTVEVIYSVPVPRSPAAMTEEDRWLGAVRPPMPEKEE